MKKSIIILLSLLTLASVANAQKEGLAAITKEDLKAYMDFFASDDMAGRETGTAGNEISALFLKSNLMRLGLKPVPGTNDYFQNIPLVSTRIDKKDSFFKILSPSGDIILSTDSVVSLMTPAKTLEATGNVVFAGYGYENRSSGYNDFEGIDIKGKFVIMMTN